MNTFDPIVCVGDSHVAGFRPAALVEHISFPKIGASTNG